MKKINEDLRAFLAFEGVNLANSSDPTVSLPLTQLRADARKLQEEVVVLDKNPGVQSQLTQQSLAEMEGALMFLQKKIRLFETAGVVIGGVEGFKDRRLDAKKPADAVRIVGKAVAQGDERSPKAKEGEKTNTNV